MIMTINKSIKAFCDTYAPAFNNANKYYAKYFLKHLLYKLSLTTQYIAVLQKRS